MEIHRYRKSGKIDKTLNITAESAKTIYTVTTWGMEYDLFPEYYRITLFDNMSQRIVKDSDYFTGRQ